MGLKKYDANAEKNEEEIVDETVEETSEKVSEEKPLLNEEFAEDEVVEEEVEVLDSDKELEKNINEKRLEYVSFTKKQRKMSTIVTVVCLAFVVGGFALMMLNDKTGGVGIYIGLVLVIIAFIFTFVMSKMSKDKLTKQAQEYVSYLYQKTNEYIFEGKQVDNLENKTEQLNAEVFTDFHLYKNIRNTRNRNLTTMNYKGSPLICCDMAANILIKNRTSPMFLGKFITYKSTYNEDDKYVLFQLIGGELSRPIDNVEDLKLIEGNKKYVLYSNDENYFKFVDAKVINELKSFKIDNDLIDIIFSLRKGNVCIGIDYSDEFMNIPVQSEYSIKHTIRVKKDLEKVLKIFDLLNK